MDSLEAIRHQINAGDREGARQALRELLKADPDNTEAWALLAILLSAPAEKASCYRQILRVDPADRYAAAWLEALEPEIRRSVGESLPGDRQLGYELAPQPIPGDGDLEKFLQELDLPEGEDSTAGQLTDREGGREPGEDMAGGLGTHPKRPGFLDRIVGRRQRARSQAGSLASTMGEEGDVAVQPGSLNPENILRLAGGPLPPEERRECQNCGAVVSRKDSRCPWCSASFLSPGKD